MKLLLYKRPVAKSQTIIYHQYWISIIHLEKGPQPPSVFLLLYRGSCGAPRLGFSISGCSNLQNTGTDCLGLVPIALGFGESRKLDASLKR